MSQMNKQIIANTVSVMDLPIDQSKGVYEDNNTPCCVGARLAGYFEIGSGNYLEGIDKFAKQLGGNRAHVILMLRDAGAGRDPISAFRWPISPKEVWQKLLEIEELPSLKNSILCLVNLCNSDLSNSDLSGSDLRFAKMSWTNLQNADLSDANLQNADLSNSDLRGAKLIGADWKNANLNGAQLDEGVSVADTNI